ncbi:hypothetical protein HNQ57_000532 [Zhongshania antarctica]|uniref:Uncharacterized protein n=1 Tax=Zhongshania antarctica TaxID=641702 RepID=A0A840R0X8_9GAMM|nr:hypothetical protein [Zhongshania antarctica]
MTSPLEIAIDILQPLSGSVLNSKLQDDDLVVVARKGQPVLA